MNSLFNFVNYSKAECLNIEYLCTKSLFQMLLLYWVKCFNWEIVLYYWMMFGAQVVKIDLWTVLGYLVITTVIFVSKLECDVQVNVFFMLDNIKVMLISVYTLFIIGSLNTVFFVYLFVLNGQ